MMNCKQVHKKFIFYIEGDLSKQEEHEIKKHVESCSQCSRLLNQLQETMNTISQQPIESNPFLLTRVMQQIENREQKKGMLWANSLQQQILQPAAIAIVLIIGAWIGIMLGGDMQTQEQLTSVDEIKEEIYFDDLQYETIENFLLDE